MKRCPSCKKHKQKNKFSVNRKTKSGLCVYCKDCCNIRIGQHRIKYKERLAAMEHRRNQTESRKASRSKYKKSEKHRKWSSSYERARKALDINYKLKVNLRGRFYHAIKDGAKGGSAVKALGCSIKELRAYLQSRFKVGMTWNNWSRTGWHIDHIIPLNNFDLSDPQQVEIACHYSNLQPLWAKENMRKGSRYA